MEIDNICKLINIGTEYNYLHTGDVFYVKNTEVPDRWYKAYQEFYKLETTKVDLSTYYTKTEADATFLMVDKIGSGYCHFFQEENPYTVALGVCSGDLSGSHNYYTKIYANMGTQGIRIQSGTCYVDMNVFGSSNQFTIQVCLNGTAYDVYLPSSSGTLALTSQLPDLSATQNEIDTLWEAL